MGEHPSYSQELIKRVEDTRREAMRFVDKCNKAVDKLKSDSSAYWRSKEMAACKRASLDLSSALVELRKPQ